MYVSVHKAVHVDSSYQPYYLAQQFSVYMGKIDLDHDRVLFKTSNYDAGIWNEISKSHEPIDIIQKTQFFLKHTPAHSIDVTLCRYSV